VKIDENCSTPIYSRNQQNDCAADEEVGVAIADGQKTTLSQSGIATYGHHGGFGVICVAPYASRMARSANDLVTKIR
jgi:hypothetical protein